MSALFARVRLLLWRDAGVFVVAIFAAVVVAGGVAMGLATSWHAAWVASSVAGARSPSGEPPLTKARAVEPAPTAPAAPSAAAVLNRRRHPSLKGREPATHADPLSAVWAAQPQLPVDPDLVRGISGGVGQVALAATPPDVLRGPYLQRLTADEVVVRWRTDVTSDSVVRFGNAPDGLAAIVSRSELVTEHVVVLKGLTADTQYFYSIGTSDVSLAGGDAEHYFITAPHPGARVPVRIWVIGDSGTANGDARAVRDAYEWDADGDHTDVWLMLGDNAYGSGTDSEYQAAVFDTYPRLLRNTTVWPTFGNHDAGSASSGDQSGPYFEIFSLPKLAEAGGLPSGTEAYYSFDYANIHFICLDSQGSDRSPGGAMLSWLEADLMATDQDWIIAYWHQPPYSKVSHDSDVEMPLMEMRENALPILEWGGVDLVLSGHSHSYERSMFLDSHYGTSDTLTSEMILDAGDGEPSGDGAYEKGGLGPASNQGTVYAVAGTSGKTSKGGTLDHPVMMVSMRRLGALIIDVNANRLDARFRDDECFVGDAFSILKPPPEGTTTRAAAVPDEFGDPAGCRSEPRVAVSGGGSACGLGFELALVLPPILRLRARRRRLERLNSACSEREPSSGLRCRSRRRRGRSAVRA